MITCFRTYLFTGCQCPQIILPPLSISNKNIINVNQGLQAVSYQFIDTSSSHKVKWVVSISSCGGLGLKTGFNVKWSKDQSYTSTVRSESLAVQECNDDDDKYDCESGWLLHCNEQWTKWARPQVVLLIDLLVVKENSKRDWVTVTKHWKVIGWKEYHYHLTFFVRRTQETKTRSEKSSKKPKTTRILKLQYFHLIFWNQFGSFCYFSSFDAFCHHINKMGPKSKKF